MERIRAFLALDISEEVRREIGEFEKEIDSVGADIKLVEIENLHVTMKFLGEIDPNTVEKVYDVMSGLREEKFVMKVEGVGVFPNWRMIRVVWVGIGDGRERIIKIQRELDSGLAELGFERERDFVPHITVGRVRSPRNRDRLVQVLEKYRGHSFGSCVAERLVLKMSKLTPKGPIYSDLREVEFKQ
ncbi:MAG: RNA 2',3'-cyclic phosphodiesterase [Candidatus Methanomethyliales bacterium]|nr:RNA 2',3'-cyclic phosphodiesterase [Candidatus Methanomethylicales archaeon]